MATIIASAIIGRIGCNLCKVGGREIDCDVALGRPRAARCEAVRRSFVPRTMLWSCPNTNRDFRSPNRALHRGSQGTGDRSRFRGIRRV